MGSFLEIFSIYLNVTLAPEFLHKEESKGQSLSKQNDNEKPITYLFICDQAITFRSSRALGQIYSSAVQTAHGDS